MPSGTVAVQTRMGKSGLAHHVLQNAAKTTSDPRRRLHAPPTLGILLHFHRILARQVTIIFEIHTTDPF